MKGQLINRDQGSLLDRRFSSQGIEDPLFLRLQRSLLPWELRPDILVQQQHRAASVIGYDREVSIAISERQQKTIYLTDPV